MAQLKWENFEKINEVYSKINELLKKNRNSDGYEFYIKAEYRKNEYVFGITMKWRYYNLMIEDYTNVMFSDCDDNKVEFSEFQNMIDDIDEFIGRVEILEKAK